MPEQFHSEDGVDRWIAENLRLPESGFYVDCGCAHPVQYSNTAFLRARGWEGLCIDGTPEYTPEWQGVPGAKFIHAVVATKPSVRFLNEKTNALVSRIHDEGREVPAFPLEFIIGQHAPGRHINLLSIDIEGAEAEVLESALWHYEFDIIIAEYNSMHKGRDPRVFSELLANCEYKLVHLTDSNAVFTL